ncbi:MULTISPECIES: hypothetical protein [Flavobacterium]|uniref:Lipoprotein n=1 Tax=Flavobacterium keumense TaxID=1306518 RepID=A0ABY8N6B5_9FLAO|nr:MULTISPECIES: hypothetical protein [Flavobacterium]WGK95183.1 hypothetical protein MG292_02835 [Flavobacterium keumense]
MKQVLVLLMFLAVLLVVISCEKARTAPAFISKEKKTKTVVKDSIVKESITTHIDTVDYNQRLWALSNQDASGRWPVKTVYPLAGAILPYHRIVAFYGNLYSKRMGVLGALPKQQMLQKLNYEVNRWHKADASVTTIPALHYIAITAQNTPGKSNTHRLRMPHHQIDIVLSWAKEIKGIVFLDVQVGHSTLQEELPTLVKYLQLPQVHLGIDPEFSMKNKSLPGTKIGTYSAKDINYAIRFLAQIVRENKLPPKVLIVHRFTQKMVTDYHKIKPLPEVQVVMNMDGFGNKTLKKSTYHDCVFKEPVQFTGFKLFYKNDTKGNSAGLYSPEELLRFKPKPIYIQYQ